MSKPFDATLNSLIESNVADWAKFLCDRTGVPPGPAEVLDTDQSFTLQSDRLFRVSGSVPVALHLELQSTGHLGIPEELLRYNVAARRTAGVPVHSVILLLRPKATASDLNGYLELPDSRGSTYLTFRYTVIRLWQESFEGLLNAGLGLAPLSLLTNEALADIPTATERFRQRLHDENLPANVRNEILGYSSVLCGLRFELAKVRETLMRWQDVLQDSVTYQWIHEQGAAVGRVEGAALGAMKEAQEMLLRLGGKRFGPPPKSIETEIRFIEDRNRIERMAERLFDAAGWDDLLATQ